MKKNIQLGSRLHMGHEKVSYEVFFKVSGLHFVYQISISGAVGMMGYKNFIF